MTKSETKHSILGSTLPKSFTPSIFFSFLSRKLHLYCMSTWFDRSDGFFLNFFCSQRSFRFGTMDGSMSSFQDIGFLCKLRSSVIPFPFVKLVTMSAIWAIFSFISCCPFPISSVLMFFSLAMSNLTILDPLKCSKLQPIRITRGDFLVVLSLTILMLLNRIVKIFFETILLCKTRHV